MRILTVDCVPVKLGGKSVRSVASMVAKIPKDSCS